MSTQQPKDTDSSTTKTTEPNASEKQKDKELLKVDDENKEEKKADKKEEEDDLSSSEDEEDDLISNAEDWDITFKLAQYLDNHFILALLEHLKKQKNIIEKNKNKEEKDNEEEKTEQETEDDQTAQTASTSNKISLIEEKLLSLYNDNDLNRIEVDLLSKTCLIDEQLELFDVLKDTKVNKLQEKTEGLKTYREKVLEKFRELEEICAPLLEFLGDEKNVNDLVREKSFNLMAIQQKNKEIDLTNFNIDNLFAYCRLRYEIGYYQDTDLLLKYYSLLTPDASKKNAALWGQLSAQILQNKWDDAFKLIRDIKEGIEDNSRTLNLKSSDKEADKTAIAEEKEDEWTKRAREMLEAEENAEEAMKLNAGDDDRKNDDDNKANDDKNKQQSSTHQIASIMRDRAWLLHWSLFVFFNSNNMLDELIQLFTNNKYQNVIQTMCPHLLRYWTAAIIITPTRDKQSKLSYLTDVTKVIIEEQYTYQDPITEFARLVIRTNDFQGASIMLGYCIDVIKHDFFLSYYQAYFVQYARTTFLIKYCRLFNRIRVKHIVKLLLMEDLSDEQQQLWLINAIRTENINAKLDVVENVIYVHFNETNPYQEMKDRIKSMNLRYTQLEQQYKNKKSIMESKNKEGQS